MVKFKIISAAWGKICGQIPQRGDSRSVQILQLCSYPPPYPLCLNIDTCINKQPNKSNNKLTPYLPVYRRPPAQKKSIEEKSIINRVPVYIQLTEKKQKKITMQILHNFFLFVFFLWQLKRCWQTNTTLDSCTVQMQLSDILNLYS